MDVFFYFQASIYAATVCQWKGFLIHRNTSSHPSLFPSIYVLDYLCLPVMFLTVMNFLFSQNSHNLGPWEYGLGGIAGSSLMEKHKPSWTSFLTYQAQMCFLYQAHKCSVSVILGDLELREKPFLWRAFPSFSTRSVMIQSMGTAGYLSGGCAKLHIYHGE